MFANDLILFSRADPRSVKIMFDAFVRFSKASGLCANPLKSCVYLAGINDSVTSTILDILGMNKDEFLFRYLGVPFHSKRLCSSDCRTLVERITSKLHG